MHNRKTQLEVGNIRSIVVGVSIVCLFMLPAVATAASLSFSPSSGFYEVGEQFSVNVLVSSADQAMNAAGATISFSNERIELIFISQSGSIIDFWAQELTHTNGEAHFEGIVLNGYQGLGARLATLIFRARAPGETSLQFTSGSVLAHDGLGTDILSSLGSADFTIKGASITPALPEAEQSPEALFDISIGPGSKIIPEARDREAFVPFESFGRVPTLLWIWLAIFLAFANILLLVALIMLVYRRYRYGEKSNYISDDIKKIKLSHRLDKDLSALEKKIQLDFKEVRDRLKEQ